MHPGGSFEERAIGEQDRLVVRVEDGADHEVDAHQSTSLRAITRFGKERPFSSGQIGRDHRAGMIASTVAARAGRPFARKERRRARVLLDALHNARMLAVATLLDCLHDVSQPRAAEGSMIRTLALVVAILTPAVMPTPADGRSGGHGGHHHHHHHGHHRFHHFGGFVGFVGVYDPFVYYPYPYYYPYPIDTPPVVVEPPPLIYQPPPVQREVVYPSGKYVLHGDGVSQPYQWVWIPAAPPPPSPPPSD